MRRTCLLFLSGLLAGLVVAWFLVARERRELPVVVADIDAVELAEVVRPTLNLLPDGTMITKHRSPYDEETGDLSEVERYLAEQARLMPRKTSTSAPIALPDNPILMRADAAAEREWLIRANNSWHARKNSASAGARTLTPELERERTTFGLATREHTLWLQRGTDPQLYTVCTPSGVVLAEDLDAEELGLLFPEYDGFERLGEADLIRD